MVGQKYLKGGTSVWGGQTYTHTKINNNTENFRGQDCCRGGAFASLAHLVAVLLYFVIYY